MAGSAAGCGAPLEDDNFTMSLIRKERMIKSGGMALDIGCGSGRYCIAIADMGTAVTGIDISPKMIEAARKCAGNREDASFHVEDWQSLDLADKGWHKAFDLVLANITPAILDSSTFVKMIDASRNWCLMVKLINRKTSPLDELIALIGAPNFHAGTDEAIEYAFSILWSKGFRPFFCV